MKEEEFDWLDEPDKNDLTITKYLYSNHLGILGLAQLATELDPKNTKLVVVSEYGEEMDKYRRELSEILNAEFKGKPVFRSGDIGLRIKLRKSPTILVKGSRYIPAKDVVEKKDRNKQQIEYEST